MKRRYDRIMARLREAVNFVERDVWKIPLKDLPPRKSFLIKQLRIFILAFRGFKEDVLHLRASALTYYTLLAIVPVVAMAFGIAKGFGLEAFVERQLREVFVGREEVFAWIMEFANSMLQTTQGGIVAGVGLVILLYTIIIVMMYVEESFNGIWQIKQARPFARKVSDYFSMMFVAPLFLIMSSAATVFLTTQVSSFAEQLQFFQFLGPTLLFLVNLVPYLLIWFVFTLVYMVMPNTNVKFSSALIGAVIAGTVFILVQWAYIHFQVGVSRYNAIYGSFAALPLLLFWIRISWLIVLFGAEISFANQNVEYYEFEHEAKNISPFNKKILALLVYNLIARRFAAGDPAFTPPQIATALEMPIKIVREILDDLEDLRFISAARSEHHKEDAFQPASDIHKVSIRHIVEKLEHKGVDTIIARDTEELEELKRTLRAFSNVIADMPENKLVKDI
ncbi:MAG: YihY/virulence factor BrkB family protein [Bacteroidales bacterium]